MADKKLDISFDWKRDGKKLILLVVLIIVLVFVWMRIFGGMQGGTIKKSGSSLISKNKTPKPIEITKEVKEVDIGELLNKSLFSYRNPLTLSAKRNPFSPPFSVVSAKEAKSVVMEPEITLPEDWEVTGIVKSGKETYAIIQGLDISEVVQEGDELVNGFIVEKIDPNNKRVILKKGGKRFILELRGE